MVHLSVPLSGSSIGSRINRVLQQGYLAKWVVVGLLIGTIAGAGAVGFYTAIELVNNLMLGGITGFFPPNPAGEAAAPLTVHPNFLLIPISTIIGGAIAGFIVYRFAPEAEGHGTDEAIAAFHRRDGKIRRRVPLVKAVASAFTIGSGGSGGREGPTAQIAAGFGSFIGDLLKLPVKDKRIAVAVGIGAGIGSIFKSPFGGAILSGEILYSGGDFEVEALIPSFIASPVGYIIFASYTGFTPIFGSGLTYSFSEPRNLLIYAALGIVCGLVGRLHTYTFYSVKGLFARLPVTKYARPMIGAGVAGVIAIFFPQVVGLGYGFLQIMIDGNLSQISANYLALPLLAVLIAVILLKITATAFTVGSGGSAGVFAPSLVIGGFVGAAFWIVVNELLPGWIPVPAPLVVVGMIALFGGGGPRPNRRDADGQRDDRDPKPAPAGDGRGGRRLLRHDAEVHHLQEPGPQKGGLPGAQGGVQRPAPDQDPRVRRHEPLGLHSLPDRYSGLRLPGGGGERVPRDSDSRGRQGGRDCDCQRPSADTPGADGEHTGEGCDDPEPPGRPL